jgi:hypothetical protein
MNELGLLFPYTAVYLFDELFSPILTPFILIWHPDPQHCTVHITVDTDIKALPGSRVLIFISCHGFGSNNNKRRGANKFICLTFFVVTNLTKF